MPFQRPTLSALRAQASADLAAAIPGADPLLRFSNLWVMAQIQAALANGQYGYLDWIARQATPFTCTGEFLEAWAGLKGVVRKSATRAIGAATFTGTVGKIIPSGANLVRGDGIAYTTDAQATIGGGGSVTVAVTAVTAGAAGNADAGVALTLASPITGITSTGVAASAITGGADVEDDDSLRSRMLEAFAAPAQGGSTGDYRTWALEVAGVTRAWTLRNGMGPGTVVLYPMFDVAQVSHSGFPQGTDGVAAAETLVVMPAAGDQLAVANYLFPKQPAVAIVYVTAPKANAVAFTIAGLSAASSSVRAAVEAAISQVFFDTGEPGGTVNLSDIEAAIAAIAGTAGFVITLVSCAHGTISPGTDGNITSAAGYLPTRGVVTYS